MAFTVNFRTGTATSFADHVHFRIEDNAVLTLTEGEEIVQYAPHAWTSVESVREPGRAYFS